MIACILVGSLAGGRGIGWIVDRGGWSGKVWGVEGFEGRGGRCGGGGGDILERQVGVRKEKESRGVFDVLGTGEFGSLWV